MGEKAEIASLIGRTVTSSAYIRAVQYIKVGTNANGAFVIFLKDYSY